jgi:Domain of unknown function (DUF5664)
MTTKDTVKDEIKKILMKEEKENLTTGKGNGLRYNQGKLRYDLVEPHAMRDFVQVLTDGAIKYKSWNWFAGLSWTSVLASLKRHIAAMESGEDYDQESGRLHIAHAACNVHFLNAFYYTFPQGDDRIKITGYRPYGLDLDNVLNSWSDHFFSYLNLDPTPTRHWNDPRIKNNFHKIIDDKNFWMTIPTVVTSDDIIYEPKCYITSRPIPVSWTEEWLDKNAYPKAQVFSVGVGMSKIEAAKSVGIEAFIDDSFDNYLEFNNNGIDCYLFTAPHNIKYNVGHKRINNINEFFNKITIYSA